MVAARHRNIARLGWNEVGGDGRLGEIRDIETLQARDEVRIHRQVLVDAPRRIPGRRCVRPEPAPFVAEVIVGRVGRGNGARELGNRPRLGRVAHVDDPDRMLRLVAVRIDRLGLDQHDAPRVDTRHIDRMHRDCTRCGRRVETPHQPWCPGPGEIVYEHPQRAESGVTVAAAVLDIDRYGRAAVQAGERQPVTELRPFSIRLGLVRALPGKPGVGDEFRALGILYVDYLNRIGVIT